MKEVTLKKWVKSLGLGKKESERIFRKACSYWGITPFQLDLVRVDDEGWMYLEGHGDDCVGVVHWDRFYENILKEEA